MKELLKSLFDKASGNFLEYVYTLVRTGPIESYERDPLLIFNEKLLNGSLTLEEVRNSGEFWSLFVNLDRVGQKQNYNPYLFYNDSGAPLELAKSLTSSEVSTCLKNLFPEQGSQLNNEQVDFFKWFFEIYGQILKGAIKTPKLYKAPNFEVLEILTKRQWGLIGFRMHFSNGSNAEYIRSKKGTMAINLILDTSGVGFMVGNTDALIHEWRVEDKRLYEVGLEGRYNAPGEWRPIVYQGNADQLQKEAYEASQDERIQGVLFYMFCTGYRAIEFVVKMGIKLPKEKMQLPGGIFLDLVKQESPVQGMPELENEFVYDGTLYLKETTLQAIKDALDSIQRAIDVLSFTFEKSAKWKVKYTLLSHSPGAAIPKPKDLTILRKYIKTAQEESDITLDTAINWFKLGILTENKLNAFLCFHIAIEGLAVKLAKGELKASQFFGLKKEKEEDRKVRMKKTFDEYYKNYYSINLEKLIKDSYFDCIGSITSDMKRAFKAVFGESNPVIDEYFKGEDSINSLRGKLAHGEYSDWHYEEYAKIWGKLGTVEEVAKGFITRVLLRMSPGQKRPKWSGHFMFSMAMDRPTNTLVVSDLRMFPIKDWKIKADWID